MDRDGRILDKTLESFVKWLEAHPSYPMGFCLRGLFEMSEGMKPASGIGKVQVLLTGAGRAFYGDESFDLVQQFFKTAVLMSDSFTSAIDFVVFLRQMIDRIDQREAILLGNNFEWPVRETLLLAVCSGVMRACVELLKERKNDFDFLVGPFNALVQQVIARSTSDSCHRWVIDDLGNAVKEFYQVLCRRDKAAYVNMRSRLKQIVLACPQPNYGVVAQELFKSVFYTWVTEQRGSDLILLVND